MAHLNDRERHAVAAQLRVLIMPSEEGGFVAQGLEIDYVATGDTIEIVQERFAHGFLKTVKSILTKNRSLSSLFKSRTPLEAWQAYMEGARRDEVTCMTFLDLRDCGLPEEMPFDMLSFCQPNRHAHA